MYRFVVSFTLPYLLYAPYANLQAKTGFIFGAFAAFSIVFTYFFVPELAGRSLEEIDALFALRTPTRQFPKVEVPLELDVKGAASEL
jgi:SP family sugar:H+ symporter-like MFS transporter